MLRQKNNTQYLNFFNNHEALKKEQDSYKDIPVIRKLDNAMVQKKLFADKTGCTGYYSGRNGEGVLDDAGLVHRVIRKG